MFGPGFGIASGRIALGRKPAPPAEPETPPGTALLADGEGNHFLDDEGKRLLVETA